MAEIMNALPQGTVLKGPKNRYQIQRVLGQGTFGITYLATTEMEVSGQMGSFTMTVQVTVKEFFMKDFNGREGSEVMSSSQGSYFTDYKRKFLREAENLSKLKHPHIVKVLESFETNGTAYYAMEYLEGGSLDLYIQKRGALTEAEALPLIRQIGSALEEMHAHQMLHLDLKPGNVMLRKTGEVVLIDFGLSKQFDEKGEPESSTKLGGGTLGYAPLEQASYQRGDGLPVTMDVYALGATLYKMLTGERPPEASEVLNDGLPTDLLEQKGVSASTIAAVEKAMAPLRKKRYQNVREVLEALVETTATNDESTVVEATIVEEQPTKKEEVGKRQIPEDTPPVMLPSKAKSSNLKFAIIGIFAAILIIIFLGVLSRSQEEPDIIRPTAMKQEQDATTDPVQTFTVNGVSFNMIRVVGGTFTMGATLEQGDDAEENEKPAHQVSLSSYYIGETEVTQALWNDVMGNNPSNFKGLNRPVEDVSWYDCKTFIRKLNDLTGKSFRLPTEAEWEFAARSGNKSRGFKYSGSNTLDDVAWHKSNSGRTTHAVKEKQPNELGIYDMSGNVWEWCQDWMGVYEPSLQTVPTGPTSGTAYVYRGGSWRTPDTSCRVSRRTSSVPENGHDDIGFRLAL